MSEVTNLILTFSLGEMEKERIAEVNTFVNNDLAINLVSVDDKKLPKGWYGGTKYFEAAIYVGAFNYIKLDSFIDHLKKKVKWDEPQYVRLIIKEQEDFAFRMISIV